MTRKLISAAILACSVCVLGMPRPATSEEYKLREPAQYVKARNGEPTPHVATSEHFALKWGSANDRNYPIDDVYVQSALKWFEHIRLLYKDRVGWPFMKSEKDHYKINVYLSETGLKPFEHGYAFGFPDPDGYGVFVAEPGCMVWGCGSAAHELGHAAEAETGNFMNSDYVGFFWECCAQFMAVQVIPDKDIPGLQLYCDMCGFDWTTTINWHMYTNWPLMEYFAEKPGFGYPFIVSLWMTPAKYQDEDPVNKMKRLGNLSDEDWADIVGDYARRSVTFSNYRYGKAYKASLDEVAAKWPKVVTRWKMALEPIKGRDGWWRIPYAAAPMQTAFNVIPLTPTAGSISVEFKGLVDESRKSDWRATIVVVDKNGKDRCSRTVNAGVTSIVLGPGENQAYLVVAATPRVYDPATFLQDYRTQERFPYEVKISGADPKGKYPDKMPWPEGIAGAAHPNGGGFVASTARVAPSAYVGSNARVLDNARVMDNARIEDYAVISRDAKVSGSAIVSGHALVTDNATVSGNARIRDYAGVYDSSIIEGSARFLDYAEAQGNTNAYEFIVARGPDPNDVPAGAGPHVYGNVVARGQSNINGGNLHGTALFIGATDPGSNIQDCTKGVYWQWVTQAACDKALDLDGLYARYDFDRANNLLLRDSVARADGFLQGKPQWVGGSGRGLALAFNGRGQYVEMPKSLSDLRDFDLSIYVKWAGGESGQSVFNFGRDSANCMYFTPKSESGKAAFVIVKDGRAESIEAPQALPEGKWRKVTISARGRAVKLLLDDQEAAAGRVSANPEDLRADSNYLARGREGGFFNGALDDLKVYIRDSY